MCSLAKWSLAISTSLQIRALRAAQYPRACARTPVTVKEFDYSAGMANDGLDLPGLINSWVLELRAKGKSPGTVRTYAKGAKAYLVWCAGRAETPVLGRAQVQTFLAEAMEGGTQSTTMRSRLTALKSLSAWCAREGELAADEVVGIAHPQTGRKHRPMLSAEDVSALLATCDLKTFEGKRDTAILLLMIDCGGRSQEIIGLKVAEVSVAKGRALIHGKGGRDRLIAFRPATASAIDRYLRARRRHARAGDEALWLGERGYTFGYSGLYGMVVRRGEGAGVEVHPHMFRRAFADNWLSAGGSVDGLMAVAGWEDPAMVKLYAGERANVRALEEHRRLFGGA
jgi:integrase/recombinase XerD